MLVKVFGFCLDLCLGMVELKSNWQWLDFSLADAQVNSVDL
jgi:hypothetical protein